MLSGTRAKQWGGWGFGRLFDGLIITIFMKSSYGEDEEEKPYTLFIILQARGMSHRCLILIDPKTRMADSMKLFLSLSPFAH